MKRVNGIINDSIFRIELQKIEKYEKNRIYCRHDISHLMDVARISYIHALEESVNIDKEVIYAAALLHDIGRGRQYETGENHDIAGVRIAVDILSRSGFTDDESEFILEAIAGHRGYTDNECRDTKADKCITEVQVSYSSEFTAGKLAALIRAADNESRLCFICSASDTCKWSSTRKNHELIV